MNKVDKYYNCTILEYIGSENHNVILFYIKGWEAMKKGSYLFLVLFLLIGNYVYAQNTNNESRLSLSIGGGILLGASFYDELDDSLWYKHSFNSSELNLGIYGFFDTKYVELNTSIYWGSVLENFTMIEKDPDSVSSFSGTSKYNQSYFDLGILAKYPFPLRRVSIFPLLGFQYTIKLFEWDDEIIGIDVDYPLDNLFIKFGGGIDYMLGNSLFIRGTFFYRFKLINGFEVANKKQNPNDIVKYSAHGPQIRIGIGYKF